MEGPSKPTVTWEDQQNINKFSSLYQRSGELEVLLSHQKKLVDDLEDATNELMFAEDDEPVKMLVGQCFWSTSKEAAEAQLQMLAEEAKQEQRSLEQQLGDHQSQMADLRTTLYARLGDSINLDVPISAVRGKS